MPFLCLYLRCKYPQFLLRRSINSIKNSQLCRGKNSAQKDERGRLASMQPKITIRDMPSSPALEDHIRRKAEKLEHFCQRIQTCRVIIHVPQKHKHQGKLFSVHIDLIVPGKELVVNRKLDEDVYIAIRDAFHAITRQLENYVRKRRGDVKTHEATNRGYIKRIVVDEGYGFIQSIDNNELYFSMTNVAYPTFDQLEVGDMVEFISIPIGSGLQAQHVRREKKNHAVEEIDPYRR